MSKLVFGESFNLIGSPENRDIVQCIEDSNVRTGVLLQASELSTRRLDRKLFPHAIKGRNKFIRFVTDLLKQRMAAKPLKRKDVFSFLLDAKDAETNQGFTPAEIGAESTTLIVAGMLRSSQLQLLSVGTVHANHIRFRHHIYCDRLHVLLPWPLPRRL